AGRRGGAAMTGRAQPAGPPPGTPAAPLVADLRARYDALGARLERIGSPAEREAVKREIVAFFKTVDGALNELARLKDDIRLLVDRYKQLAAEAQAAPAPQFTGTPPAVPQADHLGASTYIEKGWSLISLGDYPGAIQALEKALQLSPGEVQAQSLLGWAQMLHEDYDNALATFSRVLMKEPANSLARINVGYICLKKRIFGEAIEHLSKAIRLDNDRKATLYAHFYLGLVYQEREMHEDAASFFRKTLQLGPNLIEAYYELGRAQWFMGDRDAARQTWAEGHKANRFSPWGKRCKEMLDLVASGGEPPRTSSA
ncbi:MAG TPA: tetratricopeptide repeat protein, partial [Gemmatimonadales bacterium]|nr:tetratricopeptide repeat protein [Gemmatimonadales bacterium]